MDNKIICSDEKRLCEEEKIEQKIEFFKHFAKQHIQFNHFPTENSLSIISLTKEDKKHLSRFSTEYFINLPKGFWKDEDKIMELRTCGLYYFNNYKGKANREVVKAYKKVFIIEMDNMLNNLTQAQLER